MKFKTYLMAAFAAIFALYSCKSGVDSTLIEKEGQEEYVELFVDASAAGEPMTVKSLSVNQTDDEKAISNIQVFAFSKDGNIAGYAKNESGSNVTLRMVRQQGTVELFALANVDLTKFDLSTIKNKSELSGKYFSALDSAPGRFMMSGSYNYTEESPNTVHISMYRYMVRVTVEKINRTGYMENQDVVIQGIYLINICDKMSLDGTVASGDSNNWKNMSKFSANNADANKWFGGNNLNKPFLAKVISKVLGTQLYCLPNPTLKRDDRSDATQNPRVTRLVIECTVNGATYFYPVNVLDDRNSDESALSRNKHVYFKTITLSGLGSSSPDILPDFANLSYEFEVMDWDSSQYEIEY